MVKDFSKTREQNVHAVMKKIRFDPDIVRASNFLLNPQGILMHKNNIDDDLRVISEYMRYVQDKGNDAVRNSKKVYNEERNRDKFRSASIRAALGALQSVDKEIRILDQMVTTKGGMNNIGLYISLVLTDAKTDLQLHKADLAHKYPKTTWGLYVIGDSPLIRLIIGKSSGKTANNPSSSYGSHTGSSGGGHSGGGGGHSW